MLQAQEEYKELWVTMQLLLVLSHGQATVEREFSVNKEVLTANLQELSLQGIRLVHSSVLAQNIKVADFIITEALSIFLQPCFKQIQYAPHGKEN